MTKIVADESVIAVIGPLNSSVAKAQIPISNEGGLLQCSPANTNPDLTKGDPGQAAPDEAEQLHPRRHHGRRPGSGRGAVHLRRPQEEVRLHHRRHRDLREGRRRCVRGRVQEARWHGRQARRGPEDHPDYVSIMTAAKALNPESIYFGGVTATGGARILLAAAQVGLGDVPFVGPDGINDGSGATKDSFLNLAGDRRQELVQHPRRRSATSPGKAKFDADYKAEYGDRRRPATPAQGFACAQVVIDALERAGAANPADTAALREAVRVAARTRPTRTRRSSATSRSMRTATPASRSSRSTRSTPPAPTARATGSSRPRSTTPQVSPTLSGGRGSSGSPAFVHQLRSSRSSAP